MYVCIGTIYLSPKNTEGGFIGSGAVKQGGGVRLENVKHNCPTLSRRTSYKDIDRTRLTTQTIGPYLNLIRTLFANPLIN